MNAVAKKTKKYTFFIGIDISKYELDFAVYKEKAFLFHKEISNKNDSIIELVKSLKEIKGFKLSIAVFCMENTGFYGNHLLTALSKLKANIVHEQALRIKNSMGLVRGKDDKTDALRIAEYAWKNRTELIFWEPRRPIVNEIADLVTLRSRLSGIALMLKTPQLEKKGFINDTNYIKSQKICKASIEGVTTDFITVEQEIKSLISSDIYISRLMEVTTSVPFVGFVTAINIIICTNEFKDISDPKKFACYAGVAPFRRESGLITRKRRISPIANRKMKSLLHICAMGAATRGEELKLYYQRKVEEGKPKLSVINAVRYKLILRVFACVKQDRLFIKNYQRPDTPGH